MFIFDSREKKNEHIRRYFQKHGIPFETKKLDAGDYMKDGCRVTVDRKRNIEEISRNLTNPKDKKRFANEVRLAYKLGLRLVVLIETNKYKTVSDLRGWKSAYTPTNGAALIREMERLRLAYGVRFLFCPRASVAKAIIQLLGGVDSVQSGELRGRDKIAPDSEGSV